MMPGETIASGASKTCHECNITPELAVYQSPGSQLYYIGTYCNCGPYTRESGYYPTRKEADDALTKGGYERT
jgi:hypothetical protein